MQRADPLLEDKVKGWSLNGIVKHLIEEGDISPSLHARLVRAVHASSSLPPGTSLPYGHGWRKALHCHDGKGSKKGCASFLNAMMQCVERGGFSEGDDFADAVRSLLKLSSNPLVDLVQETEDGRSRGEGWTPRTEKEWDEYRRDAISRMNESRARRREERDKFYLELCVDPVARSEEHEQVDDLLDHGRLLPLPLSCQGRQVAEALQFFDEVYYEEGYQSGEEGVCEGGEVFRRLKCGAEDGDECQSGEEGVLEPLRDRGEEEEEEDSLLEGDDDFVIVVDGSVEYFTEGTPMS